jgi:hypothetical protein
VLCCAVLCDCVYHAQAVREFLDRNGLLCIVRAHEVQKQGYRYDRLPILGDTASADCWTVRLHRFRKADLLYPVVITVFSAPNYCDMYENWAAWLVCEVHSLSTDQPSCSRTRTHAHWWLSVTNLTSITGPRVHVWSAGLGGSPVLPAQVRQRTHFHVPLRRRERYCYLFASTIVNSTYAAAPKQYRAFV